MPKGVRCAPCAKSPLSLDFSIRPHRRCSSPKLAVRFGDRVLGDLPRAPAPRAPGQIPPAVYGWTSMFTIRRRQSAKSLAVVKIPKESKL